MTDKCGECVKICPVHALDEWRGKHDPERGWVIDKEKCYKYIFDTLRGSAMWNVYEGLSHRIK
mgnify:CR=1 FL=1